MSDDSNADLMAEFQEFLNAKREKESAEAQAEDFEIEIWDEKGRGVRTRRSHAKPFLQSLGIDIDPEPSGSGDNSGHKTDGGSGTEPKSNRQSSSRAPNATGTQSVARKYFAKKAAT